MKYVNNNKTSKFGFKLKLVTDSRLYKLNFNLKSENLHWGCTQNYKCGSETSFISPSLNVILSLNIFVSFKVTLILGYISWNL